MLVPRQTQHLPVRKEKIIGPRVPCRYPGIRQDDAPPGSRCRNAGIGRAYSKNHYSSDVEEMRIAKSTVVTRGRETKRNRCGVDAGGERYRKIVKKVENFCCEAIVYGPEMSS